MIVHDCKQGSPEWLKLRLGIPTASEFDALVSPEWKIRTGQGPQTYLIRKLCEKVLGFAQDDGSSFAMNQGSIIEGEALPYLAFVHDIKAERVGFCTTDDGRIGCSPDGLVGEEGGVEIKCPQPEQHLGYLLAGEVPKQYLAQVHGSMFVTGRKWWWFMSYSRQFPPLILRVERDEKIQDAFRGAFKTFFQQYDAAVAKIEAIRNADRTARAR